MRDNFKLINAQRTGALVICKDTPKAREFGADAAIYYNDFHEGAELLSDILEDESKKEAMIQAGLENSKRFTGKVLADNMIHIYRSVLMHRRLWQQ